MLRVRAGSRIQIRTSSAACAPAAIDSGRLMQVLLNLGGNAIDAMEAEGGILSIEARRAEGGDLLLTVRDTGPGIPPAVLERMYEPFFTTKPPGKGTGLGLHLVREILTAHGGSIDCETGPDRGTEFRVRLAPAPAPGGGEIHGHPAQDPAHRGRRGDHPQGVGSYAAQGAL
jgi:signal transduction histidine kinase